jgi:isoquinoline 1-oxidoreductase beta subunit
MVYAASFSAANRAADVVKVKWQLSETANVSEQDIQQRVAELIADPKGGSLFVDDPDVEAVFASAKRNIERTYTAGLYERGCAY